MPVERVWSMCKIMMHGKADVLLGSWERGQGEEEDDEDEDLATK